MKIHILKKGESLYELSQKYKIPLEQLISANSHITNRDEVMAGTKIKIPSPASAAMPAPPMAVAYQHKVKQGDTLWKLGKAWGIPLKDMIDANPQLKNPNALMTGEIVNIPKAEGTQADPGQTNASENQAGGNVKLPLNKKNTGVKEENTSNPEMPYEMFEMPEIPEMPNIPQKLPENENVTEEAENKEKENEAVENANIDNTDNTDNTDSTENTNAAISPENINQNPEINKPFEMPIYETYSPPYAAQSEVNHMYPGIMAEHVNPNIPAPTAVNPAYYKPYSEENQPYSANMMYSNYPYGENSAFKPQWGSGMTSPVNSQFGEHHYYTYPSAGYTPSANPYPAGESFAPPVYSHPYYPSMHTGASNIPAHNDPYVPMTYSPYTSAPSFPPIYYPPGYPQPYGYRTELNQASPWTAHLQEEQIHATGLANEITAEPEQALASVAESTAKAKISNKSSGLDKRFNERRTGNQRKRTTKPKRKNPWIKR
ncbi:LysM peptidoglycan-binding domain-containing protein [Paenibacillus medicaginis]|uniref:LysM peptidoglycan-binding domain-containing protein n=1 Tax=Paenibacillus medicaginis TaxID=1470560 RepID=A0ABV5CAQ6_9BACL